MCACACVCVVGRGVTEIYAIVMTWTRGLVIHSKRKKEEGNVLFNDALNTFYLRLYGVRHMVKDDSDRREETRCRHMGYSFVLAARVLLYASSYRQDNTYHGLISPVVEHWLEREIAQSFHKKAGKEHTPSHNVQKNGIEHYG